MSIGNIRKTIRTYLNTALNTVTSNISEGEPIPGMPIPNISYMMEDTIDSDIMHTNDTVGIRELEISVIGIANTHNGSDAPIDDLCLSIEKAIASSAYLNVRVNDLKLDSTSYDLDEEDEKVANCTLIYRGYYNE